MSDYLQSWIACCRELADRAFPEGGEKRDACVANQIAATLVCMLGHVDAELVARALSDFAGSTRRTLERDATAGKAVRS